MPLHTLPRIYRAPLKVCGTPALFLSLSHLYPHTHTQHGQWQYSPDNAGRTQVAQSISPLYNAVRHLRARASIPTYYTRETCGREKFVRPPGNEVCARTKARRHCHLFSRAQQRPPRAARSFVCCCRCCRGRFCCGRQNRARWG